MHQKSSTQDFVSAGLVKSLQATNAASWHEIFLGLWMVALRLVQRVRT